MSPVIANGSVFVGCSTGVYCINASDGSLIWNYSMDKAISSYNTIFGDRTLFSHRIFVRLEDNKLFVVVKLDKLFVYVFNQSNRELIRNYTLEQACAPLAIANGIMSTGCGNIIYVFNILDGSLIWKYNIDANDEIGSISIVDGTLFASSHKGNLYALQI